MRQKKRTSLHPGIVRGALVTGSCVCVRTLHECILKEELYLCVLTQIDHRQVYLYLSVSLYIQIQLQTCRYLSLSLSLSLHLSKGGLGMSCLEVGLLFQGGVSVTVHFCFFFQLHASRWAILSFSSFFSLCVYLGVLCAMFQRRKGYCLAMLEKSRRLMSNRLRFILAVISGEIVISNKRKRLLIEELFSKVCLHINADGYPW